MPRPPAIKVEPPIVPRCLLPAPRTEPAINPQESLTLPSRIRNTQPAANSNSNTSSSTSNSGSAIRTTAALIPLPKNPIPGHHHSCPCPRCSARQAIQAALSPREDPHLEPLLRHRTRLLQQLVHIIRDLDSSSPQQFTHICAQVHTLDVQLRTCKWAKDYAHPPYSHPPSHVWAQSAPKVRMNGWRPYLLKGTQIL